MATNLKTIKFGENGETYAVNACPVQVSGELTEEAMQIDFGTFEGGLHEITMVVRGVKDTKGSYYTLNINGNDCKFTTSSSPYNGLLVIRFKKIGDIWARFAGEGGDAGWVDNFTSFMDGQSAINSVILKAYSGTTFAAGTKYALEGR